MNYLNNIIKLTFIILWSYSTISARTILDVFENKSYEIKTYIKNITPNYPYIKHEIEIGFLHLSEPSNTQQERFNEQSFEWTHSYINSELNYLSLITDIKQRLKVYNELAASKNSYDYGYEYELNMNAARLIEIECNPLSIVKSRLFFEVDFEFEIGGSSRGYNTSNVSIHTSRFFTLDLTTGEITPFNITLSQKRKSAIMDELSEELNDQYFLVTSKLDMQEIDDLREVNQQLLNCENICEMMNLDEAYIFWYGWGIVISFPELSQSSKIYYGNPFHVFIPFWEATELVKHLTEFNFSKELKKPATSIKELEWQRYLNEHRPAVRTPPEIPEIIHFNRVKSFPKSVQIKKYQIQNDSIKRFNNTTHYTFNSLGQIKEQNVFDKNGHNTLTIKSDYSDNGNIKSKFWKKNNKEEDLHIYEYDENGNNTKVKYLSAYNYKEDYYFYNGENIYKFSNKIFEKFYSYNRIEQMYVSDEKFCIRDACFHFDKQRNTIGFIPEKRQNAIQIGYDEQERIVEIHSENDRYLTLFKYDDLGRIKNYRVYDFRTLSYESSFFYKNSDLLPYRRETIRSNNQTVEEYDWD